MFNNDTNTNDMKKIIFSTLIAFLLLCWTSSIKAQALLDLEIGFVSTGYMLLSKLNQKVVCQMTFSLKE